MPRAFRAKSEKLPRRPMGRVQVLEYQGARGGTRWYYSPRPVRPRPSDPVRPTPALQWTSIGLRRDGARVVPQAIVAA